MQPLSLATIYDESNTTVAFTAAGGSTAIPTSDQTYIGKEIIVYTWTATGTQAAQAFGLFNASSSGTLCAEGTFTQASLVANDTLKVTETVYH